MICDMRDLFCSNVLIWFWARVMFFFLPFSVRKLKNSLLDCPGPWKIQMLLSLRRMIQKSLEERNSFLGYSEKNRERNQQIHRWPWGWQQVTPPAEPFRSKGYNFGLVLKLKNIRTWSLSFPVRWTSLWICTGSHKKLARKSTGFARKPSPTRP